jgi:hypothetical protein
MTFPALHHRFSDDLQRMHRWCNEACTELDAMKTSAQVSPGLRGALEEAIGHLDSARRAISRAEMEVERKPG